MYVCLQSTPTRSSIHLLEFKNFNERVTDCIDLNFGEDPKSKRGTKTI